MPYSPPLLIALLLACAALQIWFDLRNAAKPGVIAAALLGGLAVLGVVFLLLRGRGKPERFVQSATALAAVYVLFDILVYPLVLVLPLKKILSHPTTPLALSGGQTFAMLVIVVFGIWQLCAWVGILRRALEIPTVGGIAVFLLLFFVNAIVAVIIASIVGAV